MRIVLAAALLSLAACGAKGPLKWPEGEPPPAPVGTTTQPTTEQMLESPPQASPERIDDPVRRSKERGEDEFDLPPPGA
jgi:predicted small lipoprotein YifL